MQLCGAVRGTSYKLYNPKCLCLSSSCSRLASSSTIEDATAVVIGGGVVGTSIAYHLSKGGLERVVLVDRSELTKSTWHKPGLISFYHNTTPFKRLCAYSIDLYGELEKETGEAITFKRPGTIRIASSPNRVDELHHQISRDLTNPRRFKFLQPDEVKKLHPLVDSSKVLGGLLTVGDGYIDTGKLSSALAVGAKKFGAKVIEHCSVEKTVQNADGTWDVVTNVGTIRARHVINSAGLWARDIGKKIDLNLPLVCVKHQYCLTKPMKSLQFLQDLPVLHDPDNSYYCRQHGDTLLFGAFEKTENVRLLKSWYQEGIPQDLSKDPLAADFSQIQDNFNAAKTPIPDLANATVDKTFARVLCLSPDGLPLLGPCDGVVNYWVAGGFGDGVAVGGGIGMYLAKWIINEEPPFELTQLDPNRYNEWAFKKRNYIFDKTSETYSLMYGNVWHKPARKAGRPTDRVSGVYGALLQKGGVFAFRCGWEQCTWFRQPGIKTYKDAVNRECELVLTKCGVIDLSLYGKIEVRGADATAFINHLFTVPAPDVGRMTVGYMLTPTGNILSRMRITHHDKRHVEYMLLTRPEQEQRDLKWLELVARQRNFKIELNNVTEYLAAIAVVGPLSRDVLGALTKEDLSDENFPYKSTRIIRLAQVQVIICRDSTTGELGYQIFHNRADSLRIYEAIMKAGEPIGIADFGRWAFNTLRTEKGVKFWGHELTLDYTPIEAGIKHKVDFTKDDFIGLSAMKELAQREPARQLKMFKIDNQDLSGDEIKMYPDGCEAIWQGDQIVGHTTSGCFSYVLQGGLCFGYVSTKLPHGSDPLTVEILGRKVRAEMLEKPPAVPHHRRPPTESKPTQKAPLKAYAP